MARVPHNQSSLRVDRWRPSAAEDSGFRQKIFTSTTSGSRNEWCTRVGMVRMVSSRTTSADRDDSGGPVQRTGERTPAFVRFSMVAGAKGCIDLARDVRRFAIKLHTREGNWDLVTNNIPVPFIQDAIKFRMSRRRTLGRSSRRPRRRTGSTSATDRR